MYIGIERFTGVYRGVHRNTMVLQEVYMGEQRNTGVYRSIHGLTEEYRGLQEYTWVNIGTQGSTGV